MYMKSRGGTDIILTLFRPAFPTSSLSPPSSPSLTSVLDMARRKTEDPKLSCFYWIGTLSTIKIEQCNGPMSSNRVVSSKK